MSYRYFQTRVIWGGASELFGLIGAKPELVEGGEVDGKDERDQPRICFTFSKRIERLVGMINDWLFPVIENLHHAMYEEENKRKSNLRRWKRKVASLSGSLFLNIFCAFWSCFFPVVQCNWENCLTASSEFFSNLPRVRNIRKVVFGVTSWNKKTNFSNLYQIKVLMTSSPSIMRTFIFNICGKIIMEKSCKISKKMRFNFLWCGRRCF